MTPHAQQRSHGCRLLIDIKLQVGTQSVIPREPAHQLNINMTDVAIVVRISSVQLHLILTFDVNKMSYSYHANTMYSAFRSFFFAV